MMNVGVRHLLGVAVLAAALPAPASGTGFPIANNATEDENTNGVAFDGTNFLVAIRGGGVGAQLVSPSGALLGSVTVPRVADPPLVAFGGTNYLLVWREPSTPDPNDRLVYGQLVSQQGTLVGGVFPVSQSVTSADVDGVAFDGTNYLVVWTDERRVTEKDVYGRRISAGGVAVGNEFKISGVAGRQAGIAFAAPNYLVAWADDVANQDVLARFVATDATLQSEFTVNASTARTENPVRVAFDGTNFLVVWHDEVAIDNVDLIGQLVSPSAALVGTVLPIATAAGVQLLPYVAFDGVNYLITWTDLANDANQNFVCEEPAEGTCVDVYGQFLQPSGTFLGTNFAVTVDPGNQGQSPVAWGRGKYLVAWAEGIGTSNEDVFGIFLLSDPIFKDGFEASS